MEESLREFLSKSRIGVIAVSMSDGSPHAATVHFAHRADPFCFIFKTDRRYRKAEPLLANESTKSALVIGTNEAEMKTLQLNGVAALTEDPALINLYYEKFSEKDPSKPDPDAIFFTFTPTWWRYTDWTQPEGKTLMTSDGEIEVVK